jgi:tRNA(Ile)-lysidine synthetase-like protein
MKGSKKILSYWFDKKNESVWFGATPQDDADITDEFLNIMTYAVTNRMYGVKNEIFAEIILFDQIARHITRHAKTKFPSIYHDYALENALYIISNNLDLRMSPAEQIFTLMPLRHTFDIESIKFVITRILQYDNLSNSYHRRFYYASVKSLAKLKNETLTLWNSHIFNITMVPYKIEIDWTIMDSNSTCNADSELNLNINSKLDADLVNIISASLRKFIPKHDTFNAPKVLVSLSGGVDSMVALYIMKMLKMNVFAFHIDYWNRDCVLQEEDFLKCWCDKLDVPLYIRRIDEISRTNDQHRDFYEKLTGKIRFDCYKKLAYYVVLGHNHDDTIENILTNISKSKYDNLNGMTESSIREGVNLLRPMLSIKKTDIIKFAQNNHIPYLHDSTPAWSQRGKIRDTVVPALNHWNPQFIDKLSEFATYQNNMEKLVQKMINHIKVETNGKIYVDPQETNPTFWKLLFRHLKISVSNKSLVNFIKSPRKNQSKLMLNKNTSVIIYNDYICLIS